MKMLWLARLSRPDLYFITGRLATKLQDGPDGKVLTICHENNVREQMLLMTFILLHQVRSFAEESSV